MAEGPWKGSAEKLEDAFEDAAASAPQGEHAVTIKVNVHHNNPGEEGPNPIRDYTVILGGGGG